MGDTPLTPSSLGHDWKALDQQIPALPSGTITILGTWT